MQDGDHWVINGEKWFSSFASMASFIIVMAMTDPDAPPYNRYSMFVVPGDTPGINVLRDVGLGYQPPVAAAARVMCDTRTSVSQTITCSVRAVVRSSSRRRGWAAAEFTTRCAPSGWFAASST